MSSWLNGQVRPLVRAALSIFCILFLIPALSIAAPVSMAWDPNVPTPEGYRIYQRTEGQTYGYRQPVWTGSITTCTIDNLNDDVTYYFVVRAYIGGEESGASNEVSFLSPSPSPTTYTISASTTTNGSISPSGAVKVEDGADQTFAISPDGGNHVTDVYVDGVPIGAVSSYTFNQVIGDHTISADFAINSHTISASTDANGSISPSGNVTVDHGSSQEFTIIPASGYHVADIFVDGGSVGPISSYQFNQVVEGHNIHATFMANTYTISASASDFGTITPSGNTSVSIGGNQTYTISPNSGCTIADVIVDGMPVGPTNTYAFSGVEADHTIEALFASENRPPAADAGPDQIVDERQAVTLSGLNSIDLDDGIAAFQWRQIQGVEVVLNTPEEPEANFTAPDVDTSGMALAFELIVTDYSGATSVDNCIVNVTMVNVPPTADADVNQIVNEGSQVSLNASNSTDLDDGIESYMWKQLFGPAVTLSDDRSATPTFQAPDVGPEGASMTFELTVNDAGGLQDTDTCLVTVAWVNKPPVADAGLDQQVNVGDEVTLDGSLSIDTDGDKVVSYRWRQTDGVPVELSDATAESPSFEAPDLGLGGGTLTFELTVTDSGGMLDMDVCQVHVASAEPVLDDDTAPTLIIENPVGESVTLNTFRIKMSGSAWDDQGVEKVTWENNRGGSGTAVGTTQWLVEKIRLRYGTNVITVTATDVAGNSKAVFKTVVVKFRWWR